MKFETGFKSLFFVHANSQLISVIFIEIFLVNVFRLQLKKNNSFDTMIGKNSNLLIRSGKKILRLLHTQDLTIISLVLNSDLIKRKIINQESRFYTHLNYFEYINLNTCILKQIRKYNKYKFLVSICQKNKTKN